MKTISLSLAFVLGVASSVFAPPIVGYVDISFHVGDNLFHSTLFANHTDLNSILPFVPEHTTLSLWDPLNRAFGPASEFVGGAWTLDYELPVGLGARLSAPEAFTNTFVGAVLNHDGTLLSGDFRLPPVFTGPPGTYLWGDKCPMNSSGNDVFLNVVGRNPRPGEQFMALDAVTQRYLVSTYQADGTWDLIPALAVAQAGFFTLLPVPEPHCLAIGLIALLTFQVFRRRSAA